jgi:hypothetical protein
VVDGLGFCERQRRTVVADAEVDECLRLDRAFEVKMQLSFGQAAYVGALGFWGLQDFDPSFGIHHREHRGHGEKLRSLCFAQDDNS